MYLSLEVRTAFICSAWECKPFFDGFVIQLWYGKMLVNDKKSGVQWVVGTLSFEHTISHKPDFLPLYMKSIKLFKIWCGRVDWYCDIIALWIHHWPLKTMQMNEARVEICFKIQFPVNFEGQCYILKGQHCNQVENKLLNQMWWSKIWFYGYN